MMNLLNDTALSKRPANFFGDVYPSYDHDELVRIFGINPDDKVLDIGGGHKPLKRADYYVDFDLTDGIHRDGQGIPAELKDRYIVADVHKLPFSDKSVDFVYCSHVLEHVSDPAMACKEIIRVGKRGFIETPRKWVELCAGHPSHQWLIDAMEGTIVFEKRNFIESPYLNSLLISVWNSKKLEELALKRFLNISCLQFYWEDEFSFRVIDDGTGGFDYSNPYHAALSHFYFARNILLLDAPPGHGIFHAEKSAALCPDIDLFRVLCAVYALILNDSELWSKAGKILREKNIIHGKDTLLLKLGFKENLIKKLTKIVEENDPAQKD